MPQNYISEQNYKQIKMSEYKCDKCDRVFSQKGNLKYHIDNNACKISNYDCKYCKKGFTSDSSMYRHMKYTCKMKQQVIEEKEMMYEKLAKLEEDNKRIQEDNKRIQEEYKKIREDNDEICNTHKKIVREMCAKNNENVKLKKVVAVMKKTIKKITPVNL
jgi:hypothetical protein